MIAYYQKLLFSLSLLLLVFSLGSCSKGFDDNDYTAYFGGEIINPKTNYVLFLKDDEILDTLFLDRDNRFYISFDSLVPGLYTFKHEPEYQYVYFEKNDSLMVRINTRDFDESVVFCGRGDEKNNFLMEFYLKHFNERVNMFDILEKEPDQFLHSLDSAYKSKEKFYAKKKSQINWSEDFDLYAKSSLHLNHFIFKEMYPLAHQMRTGKDIRSQLPKSYYNHRDKIDFNNAKLTHFSPFVRYLTHMMSNVSFYETTDKPDLDEALAVNIHKLNIADTLFKITAIKDKVLKNIAISYLLEDQKVENNEVFFERLNALVTDKSKIEEVNKTANSVKNLYVGNILPEIILIDLNGNEIKSSTVIKGKAVIFFWSQNVPTHMRAAYKKALDYHTNYPQYQFIAINVDEDQTKWNNTVRKNAFGVVNEFRAKDFHKVKEEWVITKLQRTIITGQEGKIKNAFVNLFDVRFQEELK
jgi:hypothetical protein